MKLKPCPFCGEEKELKEETLILTVENSELIAEKFQAIYCWECGAITDKDKWNTRK